jgi:hypothetical protein
MPRGFATRCANSPPQGTGNNLRLQTPGDAPGDATSKPTRSLPFTLGSRTKLRRLPVGIRGGSPPKPAVFASCGPHDLRIASKAEDVVAARAQHRTSAKEAGISPEEERYPRQRSGPKQRWAQYCMDGQDIGEPPERGHCKDEPMPAICSPVRFVRWPLVHCSVGRPLSKDAERR